MAKFYAQCGSQSLVVNAESAEHAALRLMDEALGVHIWIYEDETLTEQDRRDHLALEALLHLDTVVSVSERGFHRADAGTFEVPLLIEQWHKLMTSLSQMFSEVGLAHRNVLPVPPIGSEGPKLPR